MTQTNTRSVRTPYDDALARPTSRVLAIRAKCWDCEGRGRGWRQRVRECAVTTCPLWHVRPYQGGGSGVGEIAPESGVYPRSSKHRTEASGVAERAGRKR